MYWIKKLIFCFIRMLGMLFVSLSWFAKASFKLFYLIWTCVVDCSERVDCRKMYFNVIYSYYHLIARCKWHFAYYKGEWFLPFGQGSLLIYTCRSLHLYSKIFLSSMSKQFDMMPSLLLLYWSSTCIAKEEGNENGKKEQVEKIGKWL